MTYQAKVNDIFYSPCDNFPIFFQITKISKTGKTVTLREIREQFVDMKNRGQKIFRPILNNFISEEFVKKINQTSKFIDLTPRGAFLLENETVVI